MASSSMPAAARRIINNDSISKSEGEVCLEAFTPRRESINAAAKIIGGIAAAAGSMSQYRIDRNDNMREGGVLSVSTKS